MPWEKNRFPRMLRHINNANKLEIDVGVVKKQTHTHPTSKPIDMATLYLYQDQGTRHIPKRETLKPAVKNHDYKPDARSIVKGIVTGAYKDDYRDAGEQVARSIKKEIVKLKSPPLKPETIKHRVNGGSNPLVDTGQLVRSIGSKVS